MRALIVDDKAPGHLALAEVPLPSPGSSEALVRVAAISLNRGETRRAQTGEPGTRPGWDLAGTVEAAAADGSGPRLAQLVADGRLRPLIAVEAPWTEAGTGARRFLDRSFPGKAVLLVS